MTSLAEVRDYLDKHAEDNYRVPTRILAEKFLGLQEHEVIHEALFNPFTCLNAAKFVVDKLQDQVLIGWNTKLHWLVANEAKQDRSHSIAYALTTNATALQRMVALWMALGLPTEEPK